MITEGTIKSIFSTWGGKTIVKKGKWYVGSCAFALLKHKGGVDKNPSFGITIEGRGSCRYHCFSCNSSGDLMDLGMKVLDMATALVCRGIDTKNLMKLCSESVDELLIMEGYIPDYEEGEVDPKVDFDFPNYWLEEFTDVMGSPVARAYLSTREITPEVCMQLDMKWDSSRRRVCFPYHNREGLLCGMNGRAVVSNAKLRYYQYQFEGRTNLHLWYGEKWLDLDKPLIVTESVFDLASILRVYDNVVAAFSCSFSKDKALRLSETVGIVTLFDKGNGGDIARSNLRKWVGSDRIIADIIPAEDAGEATVEWLREELTLYVPLDK